MSDNLTAPYGPVEVTDVLMAFPGRVQHLMPAHEDIPEEFRRGHSEWCKFQRTWFFDGLSGDTEFHMREGVDGNTAWRHLMCIQGSFQPKHEHKEAAVAYLASLWFQGVKVREGLEFGAVPASG